jgi:hypothetical protein
MDAPEVRLAGRLGAIARLCSIELEELSWQVWPAQGGQLVGLATALTVECEAGYLSQGSLSYAVNANLKATFPSGEEVFALKCRHVVSLALPPELEPSEEELAAYGGVTTIPLVLPYLRSLVTDLTARAGLPPLVLDTVRIPLPGRPAPLEPFEGGAPAELEEGPSNAEVAEDELL